MNRCELCGHSQAAHVDGERCALCGCTPHRRSFVQESFAFRGAVTARRATVSHLRVSANTRK